MMGVVCSMLAFPLAAQMNQGGMDMPGMSDEPMKSEIMIDPSMQQNMGLRTTRVTERTFGREFRVFAQIEPDTRLESTVATRVEGWVVDRGRRSRGRRPQS